jgi:hypothetical protein
MNSRLEVFFIGWSPEVAEVGGVGWDELHSTGISMPKTE